MIPPGIRKFPLFETAEHEPVDFVTCDRDPPQTFSVPDGDDWPIEYHLHAVAAEGGRLVAGYSASTHLLALEIRWLQEHGAPL